LGDEEYEPELNNESSSDGASDSEVESESESQFVDNEVEDPSYVKVQGPDGKYFYMKQAVAEDDLNAESEAINKASKAQIFRNKERAAARLAIVITKAVSFQK
jgi:hypothetical protein